MSHHPTCPYYHIARPCAFGCHLTPPSAPQTPYRKASAYTTSDAIQSTRIIRKDFDNISDSLDQLSAACDRIGRRVHFQSSKILPGSNIDGIYDTHQHQRRKSICPPTTRTQIPRSVLRPEHAPPPSQPTIYIVTFATDSIPNSPSNRLALLDSQIPHRTPPIPHLHTIDARSFTPPSPALCLQYSGISPVIQDIVLQDRKARHAVKHSVTELLRCGERGMREVSMSVCCHAGTHRSVAIGERIAQGVKAEVGRLGCAEGVKVVVRHVSRIKGRGDPF